MLPNKFPDGHPPYVGEKKAIGLERSLQERSADPHLELPLLQGNMHQTPCTGVNGAMDWVRT
jgi:hypothetical protein